MQDVPVPLIMDYNLTVLVSGKPLWDHSFCSPSSIMIFKFMHIPLSLCESAAYKDMCLLNPIKP